MEQNEKMFKKFVKNRVIKISGKQWAGTISGADITGLVSDSIYWKIPSKISLFSSQTTEIAVLGILIVIFSSNAAKLPSSITQPQGEWRGA